MGQLALGFNYVEIWNFCASAKEKTFFLKRGNNRQGGKEEDCDSSLAYCDRLHYSNIVVVS